MTKGEETRQRIVEKAAALLNQRGFSGFSMSALMEATGLEKGGIYRHFDSKEQLAAEAFEYAWQTALGTRMRDLESISNSIEWLRQFITNFVQRRSTVPGGCPLFNTAVDADGGNPGVSPACTRGSPRLARRSRPGGETRDRMQRDQTRDQSEGIGRHHYLFPRRGFEDRKS